MRVPAARVRSVDSSACEAYEQFRGAVSLPPLGRNLHQAHATPPSAALPPAALGGRHSKIFGWAKSLPHLVSLSDSFTFPSFHRFPPLPFPSLALEVGPLSTARGLGSAVSSPSVALGGAQAESEFGAF